MRLAAIDCGTNTALMLVADWQRSEASAGGSRLRAVRDFLEMPRLGQGLDRSGQLSEEAMQRTLDALVRQRERALELGAERIIAVGTESLRAAKNGSEFLTRAAAVNVPLRIISGDDEARLSFRSVAESPALKSARSQDPAELSVLDIGGGSTELVVGSGKVPQKWASVPIGSVRLTERLLKNDPPTAAEQTALASAIDEAIAGLPASRGALTALAGTATTIGAIHLGLREHDSERIDGMSLPVSALAQICERLAAMTVQKRQTLAGLDPRRADVIYAGAMILWRVALRAQVEALTISDRGVRWGVLEELIDQLSAK